MKLQVFEISLKLYLLHDIEYKNLYREIAHFIDSSLANSSELLQLHNQNTYKNYSFNTFYPIEMGGIYKKDNIYTIQIRTIDSKLAEYFCSVLRNHFTDHLKGLTTFAKIIPNKRISKIYSITPIIIKNDDFGYWKDHISLLDYEKRIKENLIKKYNNITSSKIEENFSIFTAIELINKKPIGFNYKGKKILGDKAKFIIEDNDMAQALVYLSLGTGIGEINARGAGYVNYKWV